MFLFPPRPEKAVPSSLINFYENRGWFAQIKKKWHMLNCLSGRNRHSDVQDETQRRSQGMDTDERCNYFFRTISRIGVRF